MTESTLTEIKSSSEQKRVRIIKVYNALNVINLFRKGNFIKRFGKIGVRRHRNLSQYNDFFALIFMLFWEIALREVIENNSIVSVRNIKVMLQAYPINLHLSNSLFANDFKLIVPTISFKEKTLLIWSPIYLIKKLNEPDAFINAKPRLITQSDIKKEIREEFKEIPNKEFNQIISLCVTLMKRFIVNEMNPPIRYKTTLCVIGEFSYFFKKKETNAKRFVQHEQIRDRVLKKLIKYVKRNFS